jgi:regulator of protease activity HflC (stomatin/prohibitin superfamily)
LTSKKLKEAMQNEAEAQKIKVVKEAEAQAESKELQGIGIANQRKAIISGFQESIDDMKKIEGINTTDVLSLILLTQYFDTLKDVAQSESNTIMLPNSPSGFTDISEQIRNAVISGNLVKENTK